MIGIDRELTEKEEAYYKMRLDKKQGGAHFPIELLIEWDEARLKLNPDAVLSPAQLELKEKGLK